MKKLLLTFFLCFWTTCAFATVLDSDKTKLLCHFDGTNGQTTYTSDDINARVATFYNDAQLSTEQKVFGSSSLKLGKADVTSYITFPDSADWDVGSEDFTLGYRVYFLSLPTVDDAVVNIYQTGAEGDWGSYFAYYVGVNWGYVFTGISYWETPVSLEINHWYTFEICRSGNVFYKFLDGVLVDSKTITASVPTITSPLYIRCKANVTGVYMEEVYFLKGQALHTSDYTPETEAYTLSSLEQPFSHAFNSGFNEGFNMGVN